MRRPSKMDLQDVREKMVDRPVETATGDVNVDWPGVTGVGPGCMVAPMAANLEKRPSKEAPTFSLLEATQAWGSTGGAATCDCTGVGRGDNTGTGCSRDGLATGVGARVGDCLWKRGLRRTILLYGSWSESWGAWHAWSARQASGSW